MTSWLAALLVIATPDVARVTPFTRSPNGAVLTAALVPATGPQNDATSTLFSHLVPHHVATGTGPPE